MVLKARISSYKRFSQGYGCWALQIAIKLKKTAMIQMLLANRVNPNAMARSPIDSSILGISEIVYGESALGIAISSTTNSGNSMVYQLLMSGANPNAIVTKDSGYIALYKAISHEWLFIVKELIHAGASVNGDTATPTLRTPLQLAVEKGHMDIVQLLLDHGAEVNAPPFLQVWSYCTSTSCYLWVYWNSPVSLRKRI
jgi:hypothetical protein